MIAVPFKMANVALGGGHHDRHHGHDHSEHDTEHSKRQDTLLADAQDLADAQEQIVDERQLSLRISFNGS